MELNTMFGRIAKPILKLMQEELYPGTVMLLTMNAGQTFQLPCFFNGMSFHEFGSKFFGSGEVIDVNFKKVF